MRLYLHYVISNKLAQHTCHRLLPASPANKRDCESSLNKLLPFFFFFSVCLLRQSYYIALAGLELTM